MDMNVNTGSVDNYDGWFYENEDGENVNAVDRDEVVPVVWDKETQYWVENKNMDDFKKLQLANIKPLDITLEGFDAACYDENSIDELLEALGKGVDETDCKNWGMTEAEWWKGIHNALGVKMFWLEEKKLI